MSINAGIINNGPGDVSVENLAVGPGATVNVGRAAWNAVAVEEIRPENPPERPIGVVTILPEETRAVLERVDVGGERPTVDPDTGARYHLGTMRGRIPVVVTQTAERGQRSATMTVDRLRTRFEPAVVVMVGIAGLIREEVCAVGDVMIATEVVYYDDRRLQEDGEVFRPHERVSHIRVRHSVNDLFTTYGEPFLLRSATADASGGSARVHFGKIGSGEAVIDRAAAAPVDFLRRFDSKVLGVDTESGGLSQAFAESPGRGSMAGWLVIRGFSDATVGRSDEARQTACKNAARALEAVLPHLAAVR